MQVQIYAMAIRFVKAASAQKHRRFTQEKEGQNLNTHVTGTRWPLVAPARPECTSRDRQAPQSNGHDVKKPLRFSFVTLRSFFHSPFPMDCTAVCSNLRFDIEDSDGLLI